MLLFFPHSSVFLFPSNSNLISLSFDLQLFSPFRNLYSGILKAQTPAPFEVALRPPWLVPWGHYSPSFSSHAPYPLMSWLLRSCIGWARGRVMLRWKVRWRLLGGTSCDQGQHDAASDLVVGGGGEILLLAALLCQGLPSWRCHRHPLTKGLLGWRGVVRDGTLGAIPGGG